jgi:entericidin B
MKKTLAVLMASAITAVLMGCNTMQGVGKDLERGGEKVQDAATNVKEKM